MDILDGKKVWKSRESGKSRALFLAGIVALTTVWQVACSEKSVAPRTEATDVMNLDGLWVDSTISVSIVSSCGSAAPLVEDTIFMISTLMFAGNEFSINYTASVSNNSCPEDLNPFNWLDKVRTGSFRVVADSFFFEYIGYEISQTEPGGASDTTEYVYTEPFRFQYSENSLELHYNSFVAGDTSDNDRDSLGIGGVIIIVRSSSMLWPHTFFKNSGVFQRVQ